MIGIISDTHENVPAIERAVSQLKGQPVELVIHCGDIISPPVLPHFSGLPMRFVFGNNDGERAGLKAKAAELGFGEVEDELRLEIQGKTFYVYHGTRPQLLDQAVASQQYDYVLTGHTHQLRDERVGRTRIINPGALFKAAPFSFALLEPSRDELQIVVVDLQ